MSGKISSVVSSSEKLDISKMSFEERLQYGAENAVRCMGVNSHDRVFIITDYERENIARRIAVAALDRHADVTYASWSITTRAPSLNFPANYAMTCFKAGQQSVSILQLPNQAKLDSVFHSFHFSYKNSMFAMDI